MEKIRSYLEYKQNDMLGFLERLVNIDSGSYCKEGIDLCGQIVSEALRALRFCAETIIEPQRGNHIRAERPGDGDKRLFISAHLDTVCPSGTVAKRPFRLEGEIAFGPGIGDMKGGIVQMIYALKALQDLGYSVPPISIILTGDEELGSVRGRPHIEAEARRSAWALVVEPTMGISKIVVRRWGVGAFYLTIHGKGAHVLSQDADGVNAVRELALKIIALENLSDVLRGVKVSVNLVKGGTSRQVTAATATADIDVRVRNSELMNAIETYIRSVAGNPILPSIRIEFDGSLTRPPMEPSYETEKFLQIAVEVGKKIGLEIEPAERTAGSDGCFTSALGIPTLDGMGAVCHDICGENERIEVMSLVPKTLLLAGIIRDLVSG